MGNLTRVGENNILLNAVSRLDFGAYMDSAGNKHFVLKRHNLDIQVGGTGFVAKVFKPYAGEPVEFTLTQSPIIASIIANKELSISISNKPTFNGRFSRLDTIQWRDSFSSNPSLLASPYNAAKLEDSAILDIAQQIYAKKNRAYNAKVVASDASTVYDTATATDATTPVAAKSGFKLVITAKDNRLPIAYAGSYIMNPLEPNNPVIEDVFAVTINKGGVYPTGDAIDMGNTFLNMEHMAFDRPYIPNENASYCRLHIKYIVNPYHYAQHGAGQTGAQWATINIWFPDGALAQANFWDKTKEVLATTNATTKAMLMSDVMVPDATTPAPADFGTFLDYVLNPMWSKGDGTIAATANEPGDSGTQNIY